MFNQAKYMVEYSTGSTWLKLLPYPNRSIQYPKPPDLLEGWYIDAGLGGPRPTHLHVKGSPESRNSVSHTSDTTCLGLAVRTAEKRPEVVDFRGQCMEHRTASPRQVVSGYSLLFASRLVVHHIRVLMLLS